MNSRLVSCRLVCLLVALILAPITLSMPGSAQDATPAAPPLPDGVEFVATGLDNPRGFAWDENGVLYLGIAGIGGPDLVEAETASGTPTSYMVGTTSSIVTVTDGCTTTVSDGFYSALWTESPWLWGVMDVVFLNGELYALAGAGAESGGNGIYKIGPDGSQELVADLGAWAYDNPTEFLPPDYEPAGSWFDLEADADRLWVSEAVGGRLMTVTPAGEITLVADLSVGHMVPTGIALDGDGGAYVGFETTTPYPDGSSKVVHVTSDGVVSDFWTGLTAVTDIALSPDGTLYAAEMATGNLLEPPYLNPTGGRIVRQTGPDSLEEVVTGVPYPVYLGFDGEGDLYIGYPAFTLEPPGSGAGTLVRIDLDVVLPISMAGVESPDSVCAANSADSGESVLIEFPLPDDAMPESGKGSTAIRFLTMAAGTTTSSDGATLGASIPGYWIDYVVSGSMSMSAQGSLSVIRADGGSEEIPAGTETTLASGDTAIHRVEESAEWTNEGATDVQIVSLAIIQTVGLNGSPQPIGWATASEDINSPESLPAGIWTFRLEQRELEPNGEIAAPARPTMHFAATGADTTAYLAQGSADKLTLRGADSTKTIYVVTLVYEE